ncbi:MAG: PIG-L deacetylase family protein, partial [bacterium]
MDILVIVAHPDDGSIFCGGTLAKHAERGDEVHILYLTDGELGRLESASAEETRERRRREAKGAGDALGCSVSFMGLRDGRLEPKMGIRLDLVREIRYHQPEVILTHSESDPHPDHESTYKMVKNAYYMASLPGVDVEQSPHDPSNVYFFGKSSTDFEPEIFVDISG